jgi:hypothetical protein
MADIPDILLRLARLEQRVGAVEKAVLPQSLDDDDVETEVDPPALNTAVEGA